MIGRGVGRGMEGAKKVQEYSGRLACGASRSAWPIRQAPQLPIRCGDVEITQEPRPVRGNLVQVIGPVEMRSALPDVADFRNEMFRKFALNSQILLMHRGYLDVLIEDPHSTRAADCLH